MLPRGCSRYYRGVCDVREGFVRADSAGRGGGWAVASWRCTARGRWRCASSWRASSRPRRRRTPGPLNPPPPLSARRPRPPPPRGPEVSAPPSPGAADLTARTGSARPACCSCCWSVDRCSKTGCRPSQSRRIPSCPRGPQDRPVHLRAVSPTCRDSKMFVVQQIYWQFSRS